MMRKVATVGFWCGVLTGLLAGAAAWGKPADLPGNNQIECADGKDDASAQKKFSLQLGFTPLGITLKVESSAAEPVDALPVDIDAVLPAFVEQWLQHIGDLLARPERAISLDGFWNKLARLSPGENGAELAPMEREPAAGQTDKDTEGHIRRLFVTAEFYRRTGRYEAARFYYQRVHLLSPTSRLGQMAIDRLQQVEERLRDDAEESDTPQLQNWETPKGLIPLGLVPVRP